MSPRAIFTVLPERPVHGQLPFLTLASLMNIGSGEPVASVPVTIWPSAPGFNEGGGRAFDHEGEAPLGYLALLQVPNRYLHDADAMYRIVSAIGHPQLPHVALTLREMRPGGGG